jgi:ribonuclease P protein component
VKTRNCSFSTNQRLKHSQEFARLKHNGNRKVCRSFVANWLTKEEGVESRLGLITTKRLGPAVVRNRVRRVLREVFRLNQAKLNQPVDLVLVARHLIKNRSVQQIEREFLSFSVGAGLMSPESRQDT